MACLQIIWYQPDESNVKCKIIFLFMSILFKNINSFIFVYFCR